MHVFCCVIRVTVNKTWRGCECECAARADSIKALSLAPSKFTSSRIKHGTLPSARQARGRLSIISITITTVVTVVTVLCLDSSASTPQEEL